jgi:20S proteasome alpha/beta subunit
MPIRYCLIALFLAATSSLNAQGPISLPLNQEGVHGTIVVVVETRDGFVLAGDSRGTNLRNENSLPEEYQKVFSIGRRTGIVVAGLIASNAGDVADSVASHLLAADKWVAEGRQPFAAEVSIEMVGALRAEALLLDGDQDQKSPLAGFSSVSIGEDGRREWITIVMDPISRTDGFGRKSVNLKIKSFETGPPSKVLPLGSVSNAIKSLIDSDASSVENVYSQDPAMVKYYSLKRNGQLSELTLDDGKDLVELLMKAAIESARPGDGVGGSVDMLTITGEGVNWVRRKKLVASSPPMFAVRSFDTPLPSQLDGVECVNCTVPTNALLRFEGTSAPHLPRLMFTGPCKLVLGKTAQHSMPEATRNLKSVMSGACDIVQEDAYGETQISVATTVARPIITLPDFSAVCNERIRAMTLATAANVQSLIRGSNLGLDGIFQQNFGHEREAHGSADFDVEFVRELLLSDDLTSEVMEDYTVQFSATVRALRIELAKRLHVALGKDIDQSTAINSLQASRWADELQRLANELPESGQCEVQ